MRCITNGKKQKSEAHRGKTCERFARKNGWMHCYMHYKRQKAESEAQMVNLKVR